jgi:nitroreductase
LIQVKVRRTKSRHAVNGHLGMVREAAKRGSRAMELFDAIRGRRATREFTPQAVDRDILNRLIDAAIRAPTAMHEEPWGFAVVTEPAALRRYAAAAKSHLLATMAPNSPLARYRDMLSNAGFDLFYGAPALVLVCADSTRAPVAALGTIDCCLAAENLMLAAHGLGLGTCWIGLAEPWLCLPGTRKEIGLPETWLPIAPIIVGHPKSHPPAVSRRTPVIVWQ